MDREWRQATVPRWVDVLQQMALYGTPISDGRAETYRSWSSHLADVYSDRAYSRFDRAALVVRSVATHVMWRTLAGPVTPVATAFLFVLLGFTSQLYHFTPDAKPLADVLGLASLVSFAFLFLRAANRSTPDRVDRVAILLLVFSTSSACVAFLYRPAMISDLLAGAGYLVGFASVLFWGWSMREGALGGGRALLVWACQSIAFVFFAASNLVASYEVEAARSVFVSQAIFVVEALLAVTLLRLAVVSGGRGNPIRH